MSNVISVQAATKQYGEATVLDDVSFTIESGKIYGIIGRNGSGKTVLFKCMCGFIPLTSGVITINGKQIGKDIDVPDNIGIIIETPGFLPGYSGLNNLKFLAKIKNDITAKEIVRCIEAVGLDPMSKKTVSKYSMGMRQRLGIAQAIMEDPDLLILDEPMNGLDNDGVKDMRKLFLSLKEQGKTLLIASHSREDIEILCDHVYEMDKGRLVSQR